MAQNISIGDKIRYFRKRAGLTQEKLAILAGLHPVSVRKYETKMITPTIASLEKIARALDIKITDFFIDIQEEQNAENKR